MENRSKARLKINHPISAQVFRLFISDALQRLLGLHHSDGVREALQIFRQIPLICPAKEPLRKSLWITGRESCIFCVSCQIDYGLRPQHTIQMLVQKDFGKTLQQCFVKFHGSGLLPAPLGADLHAFEHIHSPKGKAICARHYSLLKTPLIFCKNTRLPQLRILSENTCAEWRRGRYD